MKHAGVISCMIAGGGAMFAAGVLAQGAPAQGVPASTESASNELGDIIVTAEKRSESIERVP